MVTVIVQHEVKDFAKWKTIFEADKPKLAKAGVKLMGLYTSVKNPNDVTMIFEAPNPELFETIMSDPTRQKEIEKGGVISALAISILKKV